MDGMAYLLDDTHHSDSVWVRQLEYCPRRSLLKRVYRLGVIAFLPSKLDQHRRPSADRWRLACFTRVTSSILGTFTGRTFPSLSAPTQGKIGLRPWPLT